MKKYAIIMVCLIISYISPGQKETPANLTPPKFVSIENAALMSNDNSQLVRNFVFENFCCPLQTVICNKEGTEVIQFTITPTGNLSNFEIINSVCPKVDEELIRVLKMTNGMWTPGLKDGSPTAMEQEISIMIGDYTQNRIADIFVQKAEKYFKIGNITLLEKHNPKKALKFYDKGAQYLPNDKSLLTVRGICCYELGDTESAKRDWNRVVKLGGINPGELTSSLIIDSELVEMKGYSVMKNVLAKNKEN